MKMKKPEIEVKRFENADIITASAASPQRDYLIINGIFDEEEGNFSVNFNGTSYNNGAAFNNALSASYGENRNWPLWLEHPEYQDPFIFRADQFTVEDMYDWSDADNNQNAVNGVTFYYSGMKGAYLYFTTN